MPQIIDLTNPQGRYAGSFNAIAGVLDTIGKVERLRQERSLNSKIINAVSQGMGTPENIARIMTENQPQYATGATGFLQQIAEKFAPPSMIESQVGQELMQRAFTDPLDREYKQARIEATKARTDYYGTRGEADLSEKDIISLMHTLERALATTYSPLNEPIPGREADRKYYAGQIEHYQKILNQKRKGKGQVGENLPSGKLEVNRQPPVAPRPYLNRFWRQLDDETKSLVSRAIGRGARQKEILEALKARGAIK